MSEKSNLVEKLILFLVFFVFAVLLVVFVFGWDNITGDDNSSSEISSSFQYVTSSKADEVSHATDSSSSVEEQSKLININTATLVELDSLPGIGEKKAQSIINYREENGPFKVKEDITNVSGIGDKIFEDIKDLITVK